MLQLSEGWKNKKETKVYINSPKIKKKVIDLEHASQKDLEILLKLEHPSVVKKGASQTAPTK